MEDVMQSALEAIKRMELREQQSFHPDNDNGNSPLHDFSKGFKGVGTGVPAAYAQEVLDYEKRHNKKSASSITLDDSGTALSADENGYVTVQQGRHCHMFTPSQWATYLAAANVLVPAPDVVVIDANTQNLVPGGQGRISSNLPPTNKQLSMKQNELTLLAIKKRR